MQVSVIIPTYNEAKCLPQLLECLRAQTFRDFEIIVADNKSTDGTQAIVAHYDAKLVAGGLPAHGRNSGVRSAQGEIIFFMDADVLCGPDFLQKNLAGFLAQKLDFAMVSFRTSSKNWFDKFNFNFQNAWIKYTRKIKPFTMGFGTVIKKEVFVKAHGYDEKMNLGEDADLGFRLDKAGFKFGILPEQLRVSARRFIKNGRVTHSIKMLWAGFTQSLGFNPNHHLDYEWGYEKKDKPE